MVVTLYKSSIGDFQAPLLKPLILNVEKIKHAKPHVSIINILHIPSPNGTYDQLIMYHILIIAL